MAVRSGKAPAPYLYDGRGMPGFGTAAGDKGMAKDLPNLRHDGKGCENARITRRKRGQAA